MLYLRTGYQYKMLHNMLLNYYNTFYRTCNYYVHLYYRQLLFANFINRYLHEKRF